MTLRKLFAYLFAHVFFLMACGGEALASPPALAPPGSTITTGPSAPPVVPGGAATDPTPRFKIRPDAWNTENGGGSGFENLGEDPYGLTVELSADARDISGTTNGAVTNFPFDVGGNWIEEPGSDFDATMNRKRSHFTNTGARAIYYDRFYGHQAPNTTAGAVGVGVEKRFKWQGMVRKCNTYPSSCGAEQWIWGKVDVANSKGLGVRITTAGVIQVWANGSTVGTYQLDAHLDGRWMLIEVVVTDEDIRIGVDGIRYGTPIARPSTLDTTTVQKNFELGCESNLGFGGSDCMYGALENFLVVEGVAGSIDEDTIDASMLEDAWRIQAVWPHNAVTYTPITTDVRDSPAYLPVDRDCDGNVRQFRVGPGVLRVGKLRMSAFGGPAGGACKIGYLAEPTTSNIASEFSRTMTNALYTPVTAGDAFVSSPAYFSPWAHDRAEGYRLNASAVADAVGLGHGFTFPKTFTNQTYLYAAEVIYAAGESHKTCFYLEDTTTANAIAYFDAKNCEDFTPQGTGLHYDGAGLGPYAAARTQDHGTDTSIKRCNVAITLDGDPESNGSSTHTLGFGPCEADGDKTFTTTSSQTLIGITAISVVALDDGYPITSLIDTPVANDTRDQDGLAFDGDNFPSNGGTVYWEAIFFNAKMSPGSSGMIAAYVAFATVDATHFYLGKCSASTGQYKDESGALAPGGGAFVDIRNGTAQLDEGAQNPPGQWPGPPNFQCNDGNVHKMRTVFRTDYFAAYMDGSSISTANDDDLSLPDLSAGELRVGYQSAADQNQGAGFIIEVSTYNVEFEPQFAQLEECREHPGHGQWPGWTGPGCAPLAPHRGRAIFPPSYEHEIDPFFREERADEVLFVDFSTSDFKVRLEGGAVLVAGAIALANPYATVGALAVASWK